MRKVNLLALVAICLLPAPFALGQGGNPPASTTESGKTSGKGMTAAEQTGKDSKGGNVEQQIKALHEQGRQAALKGDPKFVEKYLADDYISIGGNGQARTKAEVVQLYKSGALKYEAIEEKDLKIRTYGDTAVVNTLSAVKLTLNGKPISGDSRAVFVWVKQKGNWKEVAFQSTFVTPASK